MPLQRRSLPFDDPDWIYELKMDGFRALAVIEDGRAQLLSRKWASVRFLLRAWKGKSRLHCRAQEQSLMGSGSVRLTESRFGVWTNW